MGMAAFAGLGNAVATGLRLGYDQQERERQAARESKLDAQREEQFGWERGRAQEEQRQRESKQAIDKAITDTMTAGQVDNNAGAVTYTNDAGEQKTAAQPDKQTADFAAQQQALEEGSAPTAPTTPSNPQSQTASSVRTLNGSRKLFTGLDAARQAKQYTDENGPSTYAKYAALSEKLAGMAGGQEIADKYLARAKQADKEGAFKALTLLNAGHPEEAAKAWNGTGASRLEDGQTFKTVTDRSGGKVHQVLNGDGTVAVPDVEQALLAHITGIEGVVSAANKRADARAKFQEELFKPRALKPGEKFGAISPITGKWQEFAEGAIPAGYEVMTDPNGNTVLRKVDGGGRGAGTGAGAGKPADPLKQATDAVEFIIEKSAAKGALDPSAVARANTLGRQLVASANAEGRSLDAAVAGELAINIATGKAKTTPAFNPRTGAIDNVVEYQGNNFAIESLGTPSATKLDKNQLASVANNFIAGLPEDRRAAMVAAAYNQGKLAELNASLEKQARAPETLAVLEKRLGRAPTEAEIKTVVTEMQNGVRPSLEMISRYATVSEDGQNLVKGILKKAGLTSDGKTVPAAQPQPTASAPAAPAAQKASDYESLRQQAKSLDARVQELQRDYNQATSLRGGRGLDPSLPGKIKAQLDAAKAEQKQLRDQSEAAYRRESEALRTAPSTAATNLTAKYAQ